jgi:hypothetical protein
VVVLIGHLLGDFFFILIFTFLFGFLVALLF